MTESTRTAPDIPAVWTACQYLGVPVDGWWSEPDDDGDHGISINVRRLPDWEITYLEFAWNAEHGWLMDSGCAPGPGSTVALDITEPYDPEAVAKHLKAVVDGEITEFRGLPRRPLV